MKKTPEQRRSSSNRGDHTLVRVHGGAYSPEINGATEIPYRRKRAEHLEEKRRIGRKAAELVGVGETLILDAGSTTLEVARHLKENTRLTVVSNDLEVLGELARRGGMTVIDTGVMLLESVYTLVGPRTEAMLRSVHVHRVFLGADAISLEDGVTNRTLHKVAVKPTATCWTGCCCSAPSASCAAPSPSL